MSAYIPPLRLQTQTIQMQELTIGQALSIATMPVHLMEASTTAFLRYATEAAERVDPIFWTVEERMMGVAHYLAAMSDGNPDFAIGDGKFSDFLIPDDKPRQSMIDAGDVAGDSWHVRPLTGILSDSIERLASSGIGGFSGTAYWTTARMACQMFRNVEVIPDESTQSGELDLWLSDRLKIIGAFPESDFMHLLVAFESARPALTHLFSVTSDDVGLVALPKGGAGSPARFSVRSCIGNWAANHGGKSA